MSVWLALVGCASEPGPAEAWHGAVELDAVTRAEGTCAAGGEPVEPVEPFLFTAVLDGEPPLASLYYCPDPERCPPGPFTTVEVTKLTLGRLEGGQALPLLDGETCAASWNAIDATQDGDRVTLTWQTFYGEVAAATPDECDAFLESVRNVECDEVLTFEGVRAR